MAENAADEDTEGGAEKKGKVLRGADAGIQAEIELKYATGINGMVSLNGVFGPSKVSASEISLIDQVSSTD